MNLSGIKSITWKQGRFWILSLLLATGILLFTIVVGFRRGWAKRIKVAKWVSSRFSGSYLRSETASGATSPTSENGTDHSDSVSHVSSSDDLEAQRSQEGIWGEFWGRFPKGEDYWEYNEAPWVNS